MTKKRLLVLVAGILVVGVAVWQVYKYRIAERSLHKAVTEGSQGLYTLHYDNLSIDEVGGSVSMKNILIAPDTNVYHRLLDEKQNPAVLFTLRIPALKVSGVKTPKALLNKELEGGKIEIDTPNIELELSPAAPEKDTDSHSPDLSRELARQLLNKLAKVSLDSVQIKQADIVIRDLRSGEVVFRVDHVDFLLSDLLVDSTTQNDSSRILFSRQMEMACEKIVHPTKNKQYTLELDRFRYTSRDNSLYIGRFRVQPNYSEEEFARLAKTQVDRFDFTLKDIRLTRVVRQGLWSRIVADSLMVGKSTFLIYHDRSYPEDKTSKVGQYPQQLLMRAGVPISIRRAVFRSAFIEYKEKNPKSGKAGRVQFFDARGVISNITNMRAAIERDDRCTINFHASFQHLTPVDAKLVFLLSEYRKGKFLVSGDLGSLNVPSLNPLTEPVALARMDKGQVQHLHFDLDCTDSSGAGKVTLLYKDLKVSMLKADKDEGKLDKKGLASLAVNMMIKNSNPEGKGEPRTSEVHYPRLLNRSMFSLIWKSIFTGIKENAGIKQ